MVSKIFAGMSGWRGRRCDLFDLRFMPLVSAPVGIGRRRKRKRKRRVCYPSDWRSGQYWPWLRWVATNGYGIGVRLVDRRMFDSGCIRRTCRTQIQIHLYRVLGRSSPLVTALALRGPSPAPSPHSNGARWDALYNPASLSDILVFASSDLRHLL